MIIRILRAVKRFIVSKHGKDNIGFNMLRYWSIGMKPLLLEYLFGRSPERDMLRKGNILSFQCTLKNSFHPGIVLHSVSKSFPRMATVSPF